MGPSVTHWVDPQMDCAQKIPMEKVATSEELPDQDFTAEPLEDANCTKEIRIGTEILVLHLLILNRALITARQLNCQTGQIRTESEEGKPL